jgi:hypothetical protein
VTDSGGRSNTTHFTVTVLPANTAPFLSGLAFTNTLTGVATSPLPFAVGDAESPAGNLTVAGSSANALLVPNAPANLVFGGSGSNRTLSITPAPGQTGVAPITVTVSDGTNTGSATFPLMVTPSTNVVFCEPFAYADGSLLTNSGFLYDNRSGTNGDCLVSGGQVQLCAARSEDLLAPLIGGPYNKSNGVVLYASFKVKFLNLPKSTPDYFLHFAGGGNHLLGRVYASTANAMDGFFRLSVANGTDTNTTQLVVNLTTNVAHALVMRYDVDAATTTLWLNPATESSPSVTATDTVTAYRIDSIGLRQDAGFGATLLVDDLKVGLSFAAVTAAARPTLSIQPAGSKVILFWSDAAYALQAAGAAAGSFTNVPAAASPFTNPVSSPGTFFRLKSGN